MRVVVRLPVPHSGRCGPTKADLGPLTATDTSQSRAPTCVLAPVTSSSSNKLQCLALPAPCTKDAAGRLFKVCSNFDGDVSQSVRRSNAQAATIFGAARFTVSTCCKLLLLGLLQCFCFWFPKYVCGSFPLTRRWDDASLYGRELGVAAVVVVVVAGLVGGGGGGGGT